MIVQVVKVFVDAQIFKNLTLFAAKGLNCVWMRDGLRPIGPLRH